MKRLIPTILIVLSLTLTATGHLAAGEDKQVEGYLVDFGYSPENPKAGNGIALNFALLNETTKEQLEPETLWVRINGENKTVFAGRITPEATGTFLWKQQFPAKDRYTILARFEKNGTTMVETDFSLEIASAGDDTLERYQWGTWIFYGELAAIILLIGTIVIMNGKLKKSK